MTPRDWFGIIVRGLGLWTILAGVRSFVTIVAERSGWLVPSGTNPKYYVSYTVTEIGLGLVMLLGAEVIVRIAYSSTSKPDSNGNG